MGWGGGGPVKKIGKLVFSLSALRLDSLFQLLCIRKILRQELKLLDLIFSGRVLDPSLRRPLPKQRPNLKSLKSRFRFELTHQITFFSQLTAQTIHFLVLLSVIQFQQMRSRWTKRRLVSFMERTLTFGR